MAAVCRSLVIFALVVAIAPAMSFATQYMVGDDAGWKLNFDYQQWAQGKQFYVGDSLVFMYNNSAHNVWKVNGTEFQNCIVPTNLSLRLSTGNDAITLAAPGNKWYICGFSGHCQKGMKLNITVLQSNSAPGLHAKLSIFQIFSGIIFAIFSLVMV